MIIGLHNYLCSYAKEEQDKERGLTTEPGPNAAAGLQRRTEGLSCFHFDLRWVGKRSASKSNRRGSVSRSRQGCMAIVQWMDLPALLKEEPEYNGRLGSLLCTCGIPERRNT